MPELARQQTDGVIDRSATRDTPYDALTVKGHRCVWNSRRGNHLGQRSCASATTGRTYGRKRSDQNTAKCSCEEGAVHICIVADRGFGDQKLYRVLTEELKFDYVIRFRGNITVTSAAAETRTAAAFVGPGGRARVLRGAFVTADRYPVGTVLCVQDKEMKQAWCLVASSTSATSRALIRLYGKRWGIESGLRDTKDPRFGMGLGSIHVSTPERRDRLWLLNAFAIALLTLLGAAGEALGYDRYLKSNTTKRRTHSLFRQGCMLYELIPTMPEVRLLPLIERFTTMLAELPVFADTFGAI
jgi:hypothetical protein